jgi:hypothetical protein
MPWILGLVVCIQKTFESGYCNCRRNCSSRCSATTRHENKQQRRASAACTLSSLSDIVSCASCGLYKRVLHSATVLRLGTAMPAQHQTASAIVTDTAVTALSEGEVIGPGSLPFNSTTSRNVCLRSVKLCKWCAQPNMSSYTHVHTSMWNDCSKRWSRGPNVAAALLSQPAPCVAEHVA